MITEDKVFRKLKETPEIFCIADDFCKVFDAQMAKYTFKAPYLCCYRYYLTSLSYVVPSAVA